MSMAYMISAESVADGILKLLNRRDGTLRQFTFPTVHLVAGKISINPAVGRSAVLRHLIQDTVDVFGRYVI